MTGFKQGDVVLAGFLFPNEAGIKRRPALILSSHEYHMNREEVIIAAITSRTDRVLTGETRIDNWKEAGLLFPSVVTGIIRTVKQSMIERKLGIMPVVEMERITGNIRVALGL